MQNVTEHFLESAKGSRILMAHIHVKRSPGARYYHPEGDFPFCWGGGRGGFLFKVLIGLEGSCPDKGYLVGQFNIHESRTRR